jgi:hypothetical protein
MRGFLVYWLIGCLLVGLGAGLRENRCPNDRIEPVGYVVEIATWPASLALATVNSTLPPCKVLP